MFILVQCFMFNSVTTSWDSVNFLFVSASVRKQKLLEGSSQSTDLETNFSSS